MYFGRDHFKLAICADTLTGLILERGRLDPTVIISHRLPLSEAPRGYEIFAGHKENALKYLREKGAEVEELAARIGAVNTIVIDRAPQHSAPGTQHTALLSLALSFSRCPSSSSTPARRSASSWR